QRFARPDRQGGVGVWRISNGREEIVTRLPADARAPFWGYGMSPDGRFVACAFGSRTDVAAGGGRGWKVGGAQAVGLGTRPGAAHSTFAFHPGGRQLAIGHPDKGVSVYDLTTGRRTHRLAVSAAPSHVAFHPREYRLAVASVDSNAVQLFDTDTGKELPALRH